MDAAELRPLSIGEILDVAIKVYRQRFSHLIKAVAVVVGPVAVFGALVQVSAFPDANTFETDPTVGSGLNFGDLWTFLAGILVIALVSFIASQVATAASFKLVSGAYVGGEPDWRESLRFAVSKLRPLIWLSIMMGFLVGLGFLACIVPGVYLYGAWTVAVPVLLLEDVRGLAALRRSRELVRGRWWPVMGCVVVATILAAIVQGVISGLLIAVVLGDGNTAVQAVAQAIASTAGSVLTTPFTAAVITAVYFDLRVRKEGFDLELLARRVGVEPPAGARPEVLPPTLAPPSAQPPFWPPPPDWRPPGE